MNRLKNNEKMEEIRRIWGRAWLSFVVGSRYLIIKEHQIHLAVSLTHNITNRVFPNASFPVSRQEGKYVFLLHNVAINSKREIALVDSELEAYPFKSKSLSATEIWRQAIKILDSFSDKEYGDLCEFHGKVGAFGREPQMKIEDFKIVNYV